MKTKKFLALLFSLLPPSSHAVSVAEQWVNRYNGMGSTYDDVRAVAVDSAGDVIVTGSSGSHYYTAKYVAGTGTVIWEKDAEGSANSYNSAGALAVDGAGNVIVTGLSFSVDRSTDYYTAKYAAANGALLWEKRYNGSANIYDEATAVAVDSAGDVIVTGLSFSSYIPFDSDPYTAKYAAADGALLWEKRYQGPDDSVDGATAIALDSLGNAIITGYSDPEYSPDYYTAAYAAAGRSAPLEKVLQLTGQR